MKCTSIVLILLLIPTAVGCGGSSNPPIQAMTSAIAEEIKANDKTVEEAEKAQGGLDRRPPQ
jgi:hypothetical protein